MIVNNKKLIKYGKNNWVSNDTKDSQIGDLWYQPNTQSLFYPSEHGRLLEYCAEKDLKNSAGFDDWADIPITSVEKEDDFDMYLVEDLEVETTYNHCSKGLSLFINKNGVSIQLNQNELRQLIDLLSQTVGGSYK